MNLQKETLQSLIRHMDLIAKTFFDFEGYKEEPSILADISQFDSKHQQNQFVYRVKEAFEDLNPTEQLFINNDFFYEDYPNWWKGIYSPMQYARYKKRAIIHFLRNFYDLEN